MESLLIPPSTAADATAGGCDAGSALAYAGNDMDTHAVGRAHQNLGLFDSHLSCVYPTTTTTLAGLPLYNCRDGRNQAGSRTIPHQLMTWAPANVAHGQTRYPQVQNFYCTEPQSKMNRLPSECTFGLESLDLKNVSTAKCRAVPSVMTGSFPPTAPSLHLTGQAAREGLHTTTAAASHMPVVLADPMDSLVLNAHQVLLRRQIELFVVMKDDLWGRNRGRNKRIELGQVGIRCRHCAHLPTLLRAKGSVYFPATLLGLYQAAQNMSTAHIQCGLCSEMPESLKNEFTNLLPTKSRASSAGRTYWAESAKRLGMTDTDHGIRFVPTFWVNEDH
jgi:hypothetical protein